jgi:hypothetical protein
MLKKLMAVAVVVSSFSSSALAREDHDATIGVYKLAPAPRVLASAGPAQAVNPALDTTSSTQAPSSATRDLIIGGAGLAAVLGIVIGGYALSHRGGVQTINSVH